MQQHREPNCTPADSEIVDRQGLVHAWVLITDNGPGDVYKCSRCGAMDVD